MRVHVLCLVALAGATPAVAGPLQSRGVAPQLVQAMTAQHLEAIAARDPQREHGYVAALLFPGSQLLMISAVYPSPAFIDAKLEAKGYRDVYNALQQSGVADTRLFVQDMGADGLHGADDQPVDIVYEQMRHQTVFNGGRDHKVKDYAGKLADVDSVYSRLLVLLLDAARGSQ